MKRLFTLLAFVVTMTAMSQSVAISDDGSVADGSAILEVKSTTKGFLAPRMTAEQRDDITGAVAGLQIWCTDCVPTAAMYFYNGSEWSTGGTGITPEQATAITDNTKKVGITTEQAAIIDNTSGINTGDQSLSALGGVASNEEISAATSTKITYDEKGLVTAGAAATTADIVESEDKKYVTDAQIAVLKKTSSTNTGDDATNTQYSDQAGLIASLQAQIADLISDNTLLYPYSRVTIGTQKWMKKNLDIATYRDGTAIPEVTDAGDWAGLTTGAWCYYTGTDGTIYGKLYNWYAVKGITVKEDATPTAEQIAARKELAPTGWHVPSDEEWTTLTTFLDQEAPTGNVGGKMKETGEAHWYNPNTGATNSSGFTALPGGYRANDGSFYNIGNNGVWWSSTEHTTTYAGYRDLNFSNGNVYRNNYNKTFGFSVRCLRD
jgi:uncharacterized protein (TIGR02145 family)